MITDTLKHIGLNEKEISVYEMLLQVGIASAPQLGRELGMPRQTVYSITSKLVKEGFVEQSDKRGVTQFIADPKQLFAVIEEKKKSLDASKKHLEAEIPKLLKKTGTKTLPKVNYYEGREGLKRLFDSILTYYKDGGAKEFRGYGVNRFEDAMPDNFMQNFVKKRYGMHVITKLLIGKGSDDFGIVNAETTLGRTVKRIDMDSQKAALYIVGTRLYLFSYEDNMGVMVENAAMAKLMKSIFETQWEETKYVHPKSE